MPFKFDSFLTMTTMFNNEELEALISKCEKLIEDRERIKREELRRELTGNLQKAIDDILHNGFNLMIENFDNPNYIVRFLPDESPNIEIE